MTSYGTRPIINTTYGVRLGLQSDLGYLETQLGILCDDSGNRIVFHTGIFSPAPTNYNTRQVINTNWTGRPLIA